MAQSTEKSSLSDYRQGFLISLIIIVVGAVFEWITGGKGVALPSWPMNLFVVLSFALILVFTHFYYRDMPTVRWLSRVPAAVSSIILFTLLTLIMGLTKQNNPEASAFMKISGLDHVRSGYVFLLSGLYLLTTLGLVILRRLTPIKYRNIGFTLNHLGLWIIVMAGSLGSGDLQRLQVYVNENQSVWFGYNTNGQPRKLPFTITLLDFSITEFPPKLAYVETPSMSFPKDVVDNMILMEDGLQTTISGWDITVEKLLISAHKDSIGNFYPSDDTLSYPAARIKAVTKDGNIVREGWISSGNIMTRPVLLMLDNKYSLAMAKPEAREYNSKIVIDMSGKKDTATLIVNKPVNVAGWNLYQLSYDERMGRWSKLSVIEAIRDPWLPLIYVGIFMVIAGSLYLFTIGKTPKENES